MSTGTSTLGSVVSPLVPRTVFTTIWERYPIRLTQDMVICNTSKPTFKEHSSRRTSVEQSIRRSQNRRELLRSKWQKSGKQLAKPTISKE